MTQFRNNMLHDNRIRYLFDYILASYCFTGVDIPGGICYFLWDRDNYGNCKVTVKNNGKETTMMRPLLEDKYDVFIKYNESIPILHKINLFKEQSFTKLVSSQRPYGLPTNFIDGKKKKDVSNSIRVFGRNREILFINNNIITQNRQLINCYKLFIAASYGERISTNLFVLGKPFIGEPYDICTETYIAIGPFETHKKADNAKFYISTKFFRFLVLLHKHTQHTLKNVYSFVPIQDFSEPWTDEKLYAKYGLNDEEIAFIESMIRPMDLSSGDEDA